MRIIKKFAYAAVAVACAVGIAGCDQKKAKEYSGPKVAEGAIVAIAGRSAETTSLAPLVKQYKLDGISPDKMSQLPDDAKDFIKEIGLDKAEAKWFAVTVGDLSVLAKDGVPEFAVSMVATLNLDATIAAVDKKCKEKKEDVSFNKTTIAGVPAYEIVSKKDEKVVPCVAALEGQLIIGASSKAALEKQIALYRDGKGESKDFGAFVLGANDFLRVKAVKVGENAKKSIPDPSMLQMLNTFIPDGDKLVLGLGDVELAIGASADGKNVTMDAVVNTASDADAEKLVTLAKSGLMAGTAQMKKAAEKDADSKLAYEVLQGIKVVGEGKAFKVTATTAAEPVIKMIAEKSK